MKLRFRHNSLRLRVNRRELDQLASGVALREQVVFPGHARMEYILEPGAQPQASASFIEGVIRVSAPRDHVNDWAAGEAIGLYFDLAAGDDALKIAIEKDLECIDGPPGEADPDAFPRTDKRPC
jgi:hypothetical protein